MSSYRFIALDVATQAARAVLELLDSVPPQYRRLAEQCRDSSVSAPSNLAEGAGRAGRDRLRLGAGLTLGPGPGDRTGLGYGPGNDPGPGFVWFHRALLHGRWAVAIGTADVGRAGPRRSRHPAAGVGTAVAACTAEVG